MRILTSNGSRVPLKEIASYSIERGDVAVNHLDGQREIQISADLKNDKEVTATDVMAELRNEVMPKIQAKYPTVSPAGGIGYMDFQ